MRVYNGKYIGINNDEERMLISDKDGIVLSGRFRIIELV